MTDEQSFAERRRALSEERDRKADEYYQAHKACPSCNGVSIESTYVGMVFVAGKPYPKDTNNARCRDCKWYGIVDDLALLEG